MENHQFNEGDLVTYVPSHAQGKCSHPDCEQGIVTEIRGEYVFVRFEHHTSASACNPKNLVRG